MAPIHGLQLSRRRRQGPGLGYHLVGIDPDRWELMRYSTWKGHDCGPACDVDMMECYEFLHLSRPVASA